MRKGTEVKCVTDDNSDGRNLGFRNIDELKLCCFFVYEL